jgi:hypothetical protein
MQKFALMISTMLMTLMFAAPMHAQDASQLLREQALMDQDIALALAPVRSQVQLQQHLQTNGRNSPLAALTPAAQKRFLASLRFNEKGITSFSYDDLQAELTASQIYQVLSLFGAQHTTAFMRNARVVTPMDQALLQPLGTTGPLCPSQPCDYDQYECEKKGTCAAAFNKICTRNC